MNKKAFTLIELLVVVAIIGILAAVGVTAFSGFQESAKVKSMQSIHAGVVKVIASKFLTLRAALYKNLNPESDFLRKSI